MYVRQFDEIQCTCCVAWLVVFMTLLASFFLLHLSLTCIYMYMHLTSLHLTSPHLTSPHLPSPPLPSPPLPSPPLPSPRLASPRLPSPPPLVIPHSTANHPGRHESGCEYGREDYHGENDKTSGDNSPAGKLTTSPQKCSWNVFILCWTFFKHYSLQMSLDVLACLGWYLYWLVLSVYNTSKADSVKTNCSCLGFEPMTTGFLAQCSTC